MVWPEASRSPLEDAVQEKNVEMVRWLLEAGADPNGTPETGQSPLRDAIRHMDPLMLGSVVGLLLDAGASVGKYVLDDATSIVLGREMGPAEQEQFAAVTRLLFARGAIETYAAHTDDDGARVAWHFPEFASNRLFQVWLYRESGRITAALDLFDYYLVQSTTSARTARAHLVVGDLLRIYLRYQTLLERAGIRFRT